MKKYLCTSLLIGSALTSVIPAVSYAQDAAPAEADERGTGNNIVVTARRREEQLDDVPISVTAVSGDRLEAQQATNVRDIARFAPNLNIDSDSPTRAFVSIRGIGTTLADSVAPGVGIFVDGIYQPATSFFNQPLVDVERVEVLRGPQGTLFGNNTLGGAVNVVTRAPDNYFRGNINSSYAWADDFFSVSGALSGPIVDDLVQFRVSAAYHQEDGFITNSLIGGDLNSSEQHSVRGTLRFVPSDWATVTINGNYDYVEGGFFPYNQVDGPTDYNYYGDQNLNSVGIDKYYGLSARGEFDIDALDTQLTLIGSYNERNREIHWDVDLGPTDFIRSDDYGLLQTINAEARFETNWSDTFSTLVGLFYSTYDDNSETNVFIVDPGILAPGSAYTENSTEAVFVNGFWRPDDRFELAVGLRYDSQSLTSTTAFTDAAYTAKEWQPRVSATMHWTPDFMTYASVARGVRGGGQNPPGSPNLIFGNDSVWTYEIGTKFNAFDGRLQIAADVFYNDYSDYIGVNAIVPSTTSSAAIAVNLNTGDAEGYGAELEFTLEATDELTFYGNVGYLHARVTDQSGFISVTGFPLPTNRILYTPDWTFYTGATYETAVWNGDLTFDANVTGKGERPGFSYSQIGPVFLDEYFVTNASVTYRDESGFSLGVWATNLFDEAYYTTYFDISILGTALPPGLASNTGVTGPRRRIGVRAGFEF